MRQPNSKGTDWGERSLSPVPTVKDVIQCSSNGKGRKKKNLGRISPVYVTIPKEDKGAVLSLVLASLGPKNVFYVKYNFPIIDTGWEHNNKIKWSNDLF